MQEITSVNNDLVKETVKLQQKKYRDNKFLLEGQKSIEEANRAGLDINYIFVLKGKEKNYTNIKAELILTTEPVLKKISTTDSAPEAVAVAYKKSFDIKILHNAKKVVLLENIKDLGNLGTILRTSAAFDFDAIILYGKDSADLYNPKCVRSTVGNLWKVPVFYIEKIDELKSYFKDFERIATLPRANEYLKDFKPQLPSLVMFGSEADGLSEDLIKFSTKSVKIEMSPDVESLNLSVSCAIVLYKFME